MSETSHGADNSQYWVLKSPSRAPSHFRLLLTGCSNLDIWKRLLQEVPCEPRELLVRLFKAISSSIVGIINLFGTILPTILSK